MLTDNVLPLSASLSRPTGLPAGDSSSEVNRKNRKQSSLVDTRSVSRYDGLQGNSMIIESTVAMSPNLQMPNNQALEAPEKCDAGPSKFREHAIIQPPCPELDGVQFVPASALQLRGLLEKISGLNFEQIRSDAALVDERVRNLRNSSDYPGAVTVTAPNSGYFDLEVEYLDCALESAFYDARAMLAVTEAAIKTGGDQPFSPSELQEIERAQETHSRSYQHAQRVLNALLLYYLAIPMKNLTPNVIVECLASEKKLKGITVDNAVDVLEAAFSQFPDQKMGAATLPVFDDDCSRKQAVKSILNWYTALDNELSEIMTKVEEAWEIESESDSDGDSGVEL